MLTSACDESRGGSYTFPAPPLRPDWAVHIHPVAKGRCAGVEGSGKSMRARSWPAQMREVQQRPGRKTTGDVSSELRPWSDRAEAIVCLEGIQNAVIFAKSHCMAQTPAAAVLRLC